MDAGGTAAGAHPSVRHTVVGLFEDTIDAERALVALRKADYASERISLVVRNKDADEAHAGRGGAVARAIVATALDAVGGWLQGLASLIVPERGTFLVAGPIGAALAGIGAGGQPGGAAAATAVTAQTIGANGLARTVAAFGFGPDEATYLEHRLTAGTALVAVTAPDESTQQATRRIFADHDAVYIGLAQTDAAFLQEAEALLAAPPEASSNGDVVVTDAVAPIRRVSRDGGSPEAAALRHHDVVDAAGAETGKVEDVLEECVDPDGPSGPAPEHLVLRYVVVGFGGVLGLGRHHVAVPAPLADLDTTPLRLRVEKDVLHRAPKYEEDAPFSRREESAIYAFFGLRPYWLET